MSKPTFRSDAFIFAPTALSRAMNAAGVKSESGAMTFKRVPKVSVGGKPLQVHG